MVAREVKEVYRFVNGVLKRVFTNEQITPDYLCLTALEDGCFVRGDANGKAVDFMYSLDKYNWYEMSFDYQHPIYVQKGQNIYFKGYNPSGFSTETTFTRFVMGGKFNASGNVMSLIDEVGITEEIPNEYCFQQLFRNCTGLVSTPKLGATTLKAHCYSRMFEYCDSLVNVLELPAMTLVPYCYEYMFSYCPNIVDAPELPATTMQEYCYDYMFQYCTNLANAPELPATKLATYCYRSMFADCANITAIELPATTMAYRSYFRMFYNCQKLENIKVHFSNWGSDGNIWAWVDGVSPTGTFTCPETLPKIRGSKNIPDNWTIVTI